MKKNSIYNLQLFADEGNPQEVTAINILISSFRLVKKDMIYFMSFFVRIKPKQCFIKKY